MVLAGLLGWLVWTAREAETARNAANELEIRTLYVLQTTGGILKAAVDSETGQRGFMLTSDEQFLEPFLAGHRQLPMQIARLQQLTRDSPRQQANTALISDLATQRLDQIDQTILNVRAGSIGQLNLAEFMRNGKHTMDQLRATVARVEADEQRLLAVRKQDADRAERRAGEWRVVLSFFALLLFATCVAAFVILWRTWRKTREARKLARTNQSIAEGLRLLQTIMDSSADAIFVKNRAGETKFTNRQYDDVRRRLVEQGQADRLPGAQHPLTASDIEVMEQGEARTIEEHVVIDGETRTLAIEKMPWLRGGEVVGMIAVSRDVTENRLRESELQEVVDRRTAELRAAISSLQQEMEEREAAEQAMRHMQRIESLGQLTGGIAHDFNNMLAIVLGSLAMARRRIPEDCDPKLAIALDNAEEGATRAAELTARLLAFARAQPLDARPVEINTLVSKTGRLLERSLGGNIALVFDLDPAAGWVEIDAPQLESALVNLAVNARDAMPDGGTLTIATRREGKHLRLTIADTGDGMPEAIKARAFEPFFTTKQIGKGTGLGLSQVHGFIVQSGGSVTIETAAGKGTTIAIVLPCTAAAADFAMLRHVPEPHGLGQAILVVEDEPLVRKVAEEALATRGYEVLTASSGEEALAILAGRGDVALMLADVAMPGMEGTELAAAASAAHPRLRIVLTTGFGPRSTEGFDWPVLTKPYLIEQLEQTVGAMLRAAPGAPVLAENDRQFGT